MSRTQCTRRAGILVPLFSIPSSRSWGIGEIGDLVPMARWLASGGQRFIQLLPINEMPVSETSPYSALSAMAIDPQFISMHQVDDFLALGGERALRPALAERLGHVRRSPTVDYPLVRDLKLTVLREAFAHFRDVEWTTTSPRAARFRTYLHDQAWWLEDYALFRALRAHFGDQPWTEWPEPLRAREARALDQARVAHADEILFRQYIQWLAGEQWAAARVVTASVALFGDLPFMVGLDSADVWVHQDAFRLDVSVGVPPDAFSDTGQDWGLPAYRWDVFSQRDFEWLRARARRNADLYDGYRVDHLVGFYRTYFRPRDGSAPRFTPEQEDQQLALGERVLGVFRDSGAEIIAEDLGTVPDFVRDSLVRLAVPGYKVFRWERYWHGDGQPFKDPLDYPATAVATSGTHDTEPMVTWWEQAGVDERRAVLAIGSMQSRLTDDARTRALQEGTLSPEVRDALLEALFGSGADLLILPIQDVFGWRDRINQPATVADTNWTWRLPWPVERLMTEPDASAVAKRLKTWTAESGRDQIA